MFSKKVFIVAEVSANHGQNLNRAVSMIKKAKETAKKMKNKGLDIVFISEITGLTKEEVVEYLSKDFGVSFKEDEE